MDGYAVRAADVATAPATLKVDRRSRGRPSVRRRRSAPGEAARIFTGGVVPDGADTVVIQEDTDARRRRASSSTRPRRAAGTSAAPGSISAKATCCCRAAAGSPTATCRSPPRMNHPALPVHRRPKVALLATGDELVLPGSDARPRPDRLFQRLRAARAGARAKAPRSIDLGIAAGHASRPRSTAIRRARDAGADILVTTGGASVGDHDLVQHGAGGRGRSTWRSGGSRCGPASR